MHQNAINLGGTLIEYNKSFSQNKVNPMIFLHHHINETLKNEYLIVTYAYMLWQDLKEMYDHHRHTLLHLVNFIISFWLLNLNLDFSVIYNNATRTFTKQSHFFGSYWSCESCFFVRSNETKFHIIDAIYSNRSKQNLFCLNIQAIMDIILKQKMKVTLDIHVLFLSSRTKSMYEMLLTFSFELHHTIIRMVESLCVTSNMIFAPKLRML